MNTNENHSFRLPAEWEPQSGVILIWPHEDTDWRPYLEEITEVYLQMADAITRYEALLITARDTEMVSSLLKERLTEEQMKRVTLFTCDNNDTWARDVAPISLIANKASKDSSQPLRLLDFCFNGWGEKFAAEKDNRINRQLHEAGLLQGVLESHKDFVLEGGSIESDGSHTLFTTTSCLMAPHRNQPLTQEDIDKQLRLFFPNVERVIWLDYGQLAGDDTDGHIDTIVRIAPNNTLLYIGCDDKEDEHYEDFRLLEEQLKQLRTQKGEPYRLLRLPMPDAIYDDDERLPATHANFLIINGAVLVPTYNQPEKDMVAHGEGRFYLPEAEDKYNVIAKYNYAEYPGNPNGSDYNVAGICSADGRHLAMMPHLERAIFPWQQAYYPRKRRQDEVTPWIEAFVNARKWVESKL